MDQHPSPIKVFLAEDSAPIRRRLAQMLRDKGMAVTGQAQTPAQCINNILADPPDVVVLDIQLEGGAGMEVLNAVRDAAPGIAFVVLSNNSGTGYRERYLSAGAYRFLDKSTEFDQLALAVEDASKALRH
jgi:DNA-binding NarL/FixJ family response regulator